jgi:selenocysteine lyase/cysteine desulfurase
MVAGLEWLSQNQDAMLKARAMARELADWVHAHPRCKLLGGVDVERTATVAFVMEGLPLQRTQGEFAQRGLDVRAGSHCAPWALEALGVHDGALRVSFGPFNGQADLAALKLAVDALS